MYTTCIFDLDGTIASTLDTIAYFGNLALKKFGLKEIETNKYKYLVGDGARNLVLRMLEQVSAPQNIFDEIYKYYIMEYDKDFMYKTTPYEGVPRLLNTLKDRGMKLGVFSNKPHKTAVYVAEALYGKGFFDVCRGNEEGKPIKPDPAVLFEILNEINARKENCVYVGDTGVDINTGKNAGIYTIGVLWGFREYRELGEAGADLIISHPDELLNFLDSSI